MDFFLRTEKQIFPYMLLLLRVTVCDRHCGIYIVLESYINNNRPLSFCTRKRMAVQLAENHCFFFLL